MPPNGHLKIVCSKMVAPKSLRDIAEHLIKTFFLNTLMSLSLSVAVIKELIICGPKRRR